MRTCGNSKKTFYGTPFKETLYQHLLKYWAPDVISQKYPSVLTHLTNILFTGQCL